MVASTCWGGSPSLVSRPSLIRTTPARCWSWRRANSLATLRSTAPSRVRPPSGGSASQCVADRLDGVLVLGASGAASGSLADRAQRAPVAVEGEHVQDEALRSTSRSSRSPVVARATRLTSSPRETSLRLVGRAPGGKAASMQLALFLARRTCPSPSCSRCCRPARRGATARRRGAPPGGTGPPRTRRMQQQHERAQQRETEARRQAGATALLRVERADPEEARR